jgi:hypothetical protein
MVFGSHFRNLARSPNYGLRRRRKEYGSDDDRPVGPKLVRGRGLFRRRRPESVAWLLFVTAMCVGIATVGIALILSGSVWSY